MDPQHGYRHCFSVKEFNKVSQREIIGKIKKKELERKTQVKIILISLLSLFIVLCLFGSSALSLAFLASSIVSDLIMYWITRDKDYAIVACAGIVATGVYFFE
ncbi:MAG: hypothetical protein HXS54_03090 [Theionarchaea archaeon]|nr:hypothetical protein [Theionarchaea archaeon]